MRAMDEGGKIKWQELQFEERAELTRLAQTAFAAPYHSKTRETPGGTSNVKNVYEIYQFYPEGHLTVGLWWDNHGNGKEYYERRGWVLEIASLGEGAPKLKEAKG